MIAELFSDRAVFVAHLAATLFMVGVIWIVQVVHYPLFAHVGAEGFPEYERLHSVRITWVVAPAMLVEMATALLLLWSRPAGVRLGEVWLGLALLAVIWLSTAFLQVPRHNALAAGFDSLQHRGLVLGNWVRTVAWSGRGVLVLVWVWRQLQGGPRPS